MGTVIEQNPELGYFKPFIDSLKSSFIYLKQFIVSGRAVEE